MIYLVTNQTKLFEDASYHALSVPDSIRMMESWDIVQFDSETSGRNPRLCNLLCIQFGNDKADARIVVDTTTVKPELYKDILEKRLCVLHNAKFDLQFLYNHNIIPRRLYDTMIAEQLLHLGFPSISLSPSDYNKGNYNYPYLVTGDAVFPKYSLSFSLKAVAQKRLNIDIDKTVRGEIIWRGLDSKVIGYAAGDVTYLEKIMWSQIEDLKKQGLMKATKIEFDFIPAIAYLEWCGIHLDQKKWKSKMASDQKKLEEAKEMLNRFVESREDLREYVEINNQGDLFTGFDTSPKCNVNWNSSIQVVKLAKKLGFDTSVKDKKTGEDKNSVLEKHLKKQKGICDEFLDLYFDYQEHFKTTTSFGEGHLNAINPVTDRIHTVYRQLGTASGRMSCGSQQPDTDLAKYKKLKPSDCTYPNTQQLPHDETTRACFTAPEGYEWCSCDYSALESRLGADIYNEPHMIEEFLHGSGDIHSLMAITFFGDQMEEGITTKEVKKKYPKLRSAAKSPEFLIQFGGSAYGLATQLAVPEEEAQKYVDAYYSKFKGIAEFKKKGSEFVRKNGYVLMCEYTGHKMYWWDHNEWVERQKSFTQEFWEDYRLNHKGTGDAVARMVSEHFRAASKWDRMALNAVTQGTGCVILKKAITDFFNWIVDNGYFSKVEIAALVHDEANIVYPSELHDIVPKKLKECMENSANMFCKKLPIPAEASVGNCWIH